jgi:hypothetical protein
VFLPTRRNSSIFSFSILTKVNAASVERNMAMFVHLSRVNVFALFTGKPERFYIQDHRINRNLQSLLA